MGVFWLLLCTEVTIVGLVIIEGEVSYKIKMVMI